MPQRGGAWRHKALRMRLADPDRTMSSIARELGVTPSAVYKALNPEKAREWNRRENADPARKKAKREWDRKWAHSEKGRGYCIGCGELRGAGAMKRTDEGLCMACVHVVAEARRSIIAGMYLDGWLLREMGEVLGMPTTSVAAWLHALRSEGWDLPHRYKAWERAAA